jgi:hypothetical protein
MSRDKFFKKVTRHRSDEGTGGLGLENVYVHAAGNACGDTGEGSRLKERGLWR